MKKRKHLQFVIFISLFLMANISFTQNGILDVNFGTNGIVKTDINNLFDAFSAVTVQNDGKIIVIGHTSTASTANKESIIVRYNADGSLDTSFGTNGIIIAAFSTAFDSLNAVEIQDDGKIIVAGINGIDFVVARYTTDGVLDTTFGTNGVVFTNYRELAGVTSDDRARCIAIQKDGKILVGGRAILFGTYYYAIVRYNADGTIDTSFGDNGRIIDHAHGGYKQINDLIVTSEGKIYAVGEMAVSQNSSYNSQCIARFNSDGSLDLDFAINGRRFFDLNSNSGFEAMQQQPDGKFVIVGNLGVRVTVVRVSENAVLDDSFSDNGRDDPPLGTSSNFGKSISVLSDGRILVSSSINSTSNGNSSSVVVYLPNGELDSTFADNGISNYAIGDGYQGGGFSAVQPDGKILVGGDFNDSTTNTTDLYLYRLTSAVLSTDPFEMNNHEVTLSPNPVSDSLNLKMNLKTDNVVNIDLYDITGKKLTTLLENKLITAGDHTINFDVSHLKTKLALVVLKIGDYTKTIKLVK